MTRAELVRRERERSRAYDYAFWILGFAIVGGMFAIPGNGWLAVLIVGFGAISIFNQGRMSKCPRCRRVFNGAIAIATDRCGRCGEIAVEDPRIVSNQAP